MKLLMLRDSCVIPIFVMMFELQTLLKRFINIFVYCVKVGMYWMVKSLAWDPFLHVLVLKSCVQLTSTWVVRMLIPIGNLSPLFVVFKKNLRMCFSDVK